MNNVGLHSCRIDLAQSVFKKMLNQIGKSIQMNLTVKSAT
jgi:hypothetical protein